MEIESPAPIPMMDETFDSGAHKVSATFCDSEMLLAKQEVQPDSPLSAEKSAATKVQRFYRGYRTRRQLADSAVVAEEYWWQALDFARLNHRTVSFFDHMKHENVVSRWCRVGLNASKVGKGLSKDAKALKLAFQHWIEAIDPRHRYGHNLHFYYDKWCESQAGQPFFYWLDVGEGKNVDLEKCPRVSLRNQCVKYLGPQEREHYEYVVLDGQIVHKQTGEPLHTVSGTKGTKWIFVMSTAKRLYAGQKKKGAFHHSSFLAGGTTLAAGRFSVENGILKSISPYSGHYRPNEENLDKLLDLLKENGVDMDQVQVSSSSNDDYDDDPKQSQLGKVVELWTAPKPPALLLPPEMVNIPQVIQSAEPETSEMVKIDEAAGTYKRTLSGGIQSPKTEVPRKAILERINSKKESTSYQLGRQLSLKKWSSGAGPRIGCVADYPLEVRVQALEFVNLSPKNPAQASKPPSPSCSSVLSPVPTR